MARQAKPFLYRGWYCTNAGGTPQQKLCKEEEGKKQADLALARLLVQRADAVQEAKLAVPGPGIRANLPPVLPTQQAAANYAPGLAGPQPKTVAEVYDDFMAVKKAEKAEGTYDWYRDKLDAFFERFGTRPIASITYEEGLDYKTWLRKEKPWTKGKTPMKGVGATSVNHHVRAAKTLLEWASKPSRRDKYGMTINPWEEIKFLTEKPRERVITDDEVRHLLAHCTDGNIRGGAQDFRETLMALRYTTMRPGELRLLRWEYIQWENNRIVFPPQVIKVRKRREATMIDKAKNALLARKERLKADASCLVFPRRGHVRKGVAVATDPVQSANGFSQRFRRLFFRCVELGLVEKEKAGERIVPYSTRHTRITELFVEGNDHAVVMFDAGHVNPATTERYKHLAGSHVANSIRRRSQQHSSTDAGGD